MNNSFEELREIMANSERIVIGGHQNPDGDAIGACFALARSLKKMGKDVRVALQTYATKYEVIPGKELLLPEECYTDLDVELFISLDCGDRERLKEATELFDKAEKTINIDHHRSNRFFGQYNFVDADASSTCEIIYRLLRDEMPVDMDIAAALYAGIIYDTAGFRHSSTSPFTMMAAGDLLTYSIPFNTIYTRFFDNRSFSEMKITGRAYDNAKQLYDGKFIYTTITTAEVAECNGTNKELDTIINYMKGVQGTKVACFLYEKNPDEVKASFRGDDGYDVCALSEKFGGGGHVKAAGCTINDSIENALKLVLAEIEQMI